MKRMGTERRIRTIERCPVSNTLYYEDVIVFCPFYKLLHLVEGKILQINFDYALHISKSI